MRFSPDYIQFYPTLRCNLSCNFCFNKSMPFCDDITLHDFKDMVDRLHKLNINTIDIMGGEPTLHRDIIPMVGYAVNKMFRINLSSNGTGLNALSEIMGKCRGVNIGLSINDGLMLRRLKGFIKKYRPVVKMVFMDNIDAKLLRKILISNPNRLYLLYLDVMRTEHIGNAVHFSQFLFAVQRLKSSMVDMVDTVYCSGFIPDTVKYPELSKTRCPAGTTKLGVMPDGSVYPCNLFFGIEKFRLGNLLYDSFEDIWKHRRLDFFRTFNGNVCPQTKCILHESCHGGCPAHSFIHYGSIGSPEPRCV